MVGEYPVTDTDASVIGTDSIAPVPVVTFTVPPVRLRASLYLYAVFVGLFSIATLPTVSFTKTVEVAVFPLYVNVIF